MFSGCAYLNRFFVSGKPSEEIPLLAEVDVHCPFSGLLVVTDTGMTTGVVTADLFCGDELRYECAVHCVVAVFCTGYACVAVQASAALHTTPPDIGGRHILFRAAFTAETPYIL